MTRGGISETVLDAFGHRYRRRLLVALSRHNPQGDDDPQGSRVELGSLDLEATDETVETELFQVHLPKLEDYGYINWDQESGEISKGPKWDEISPIIHLLQDNEGALPDDWL